LATARSAPPAAWCPSNYFDVLGIHPILGRTFEPDEDTGHNAHPVTVISYQAWKARYQRDPAILGKTQRLNGVEHTIIGVMPEGFFGTFVGYGFQFWVPASMEDSFEGGGYKLESRDARWSEGFAFLKPGVTIAQAQAELSAIASRLAAANPETNRGRGFQLYPLWQTPFNGAGTLLPTLRISLVVGGPGAADRLCECRQSAAGAVLFTAARDDCAAGGGGCALAPLETAPHGRF
jgi:hypothetical protein